MKMIRERVVMTLQQAMNELDAVKDKREFLAALGIVNTENQYMRFQTCPVARYLTLRTGKLCMGCSDYFMTSGGAEVAYCTSSVRQFVRELDAEFGE